MSDFKIKVTADLDTSQVEATCDKKTSNVTFLILFLNKLDSYNIMVFRTYFLSFGIL